MRFPKSEHILLLKFVSNLILFSSLTWFGVALTILIVLIVRSRIRKNMLVDVVDTIIDSNSPRISLALTSRAIFLILLPFDSN